MRKKFHDYYVTIGLEIHVALKTEKKLFSNTSNEFNCATFDLLDCGLPGVLPHLNHEPVKLAILFGLATKSQIHLESEFERKHYFYPDLALGYQITQQHNPILGEGLIPIKINDEIKHIQIEHSHLECDAAKSIHDLYNDYTAIDISRGGSPLLEIVSKPCMYSPEEAKEYAKTIHSLVKSLNICDGKMEEGSYRVDASISISKDEHKLGTRVEIKNISSFSFLEAALYHEITRQSELLDSNQKVLMQTRLFDESTKTTMAMRDKETVLDYRYLVDPDIPELVFDEDFVKEIQNEYFYEYFELIEFFQKLSQNFKIDLASEKISDCLSTQLKSYLISLHNTKSLQQIISPKLIRAVFYWIPEVIAKKDKDYFTLPTLEQLIEIIKSPIEAKEFKDLLIKYDENPTIQLSQLIPNDSVESLEFVKETILKMVQEFDSQLKDPKLAYDKKIQFIMGKCMKELKGKIPASKLNEEIKKIIIG